MKTICIMTTVWCIICMAFVIQALAPVDVYSNSQKVTYSGELEEKHMAIMSIREDVSTIQNSIARKMLKTNTYMWDKKVPPIHITGKDIVSMIPVDAKIGILPTQMKSALLPASRFNPLVEKQSEGEKQ